VYNVSIVAEKYVDRALRWLAMREILLKFKLHIILAMSLICLGSVVYGVTQETVSANDEKTIIVVKPGMIVHDVSELLYEQGVIKSKILFQMVAKMEGLDHSLQSGEYAVRSHMTMQQIAALLSTGQTTQKQITIPEGYTIVQIATLLHDKQLASIEKFKAVAQKKAPYVYMANDNPNVIYQAEGYVFPDTYQIANGATEEQIISMMMNQFDTQMTEGMRTKAAEMGLSIKEVIILASLVEKEAQLPEDRPLIAGVFMNRLKKEMPLQSCATIQYILGYPKPELSVKDTEIESPYNTYQHMGLPPGPIANPGIAAINAVLYPAKTEYLFFVADKQGAHHFSKTYGEHLVMIEQVDK